jgi:hypothetical protein
MATGLAKLPYNRGANSDVGAIIAALPRGQPEFLSSAVVVIDQHRRAAVLVEDGSRY